MHIPRAINLPRFLAATTLLISAFSQVSCRDRHWENRTFTSEQRQLLEPAENAEEWLQRFELDLKHQNYSSKLLSELYAELPPMDQWPEICDKLDEIANDKARLSKLSQGSRSNGSIETLSEKILIFSALLRKADADVEPRVRTLISENQISEYSNEEALNALFMSSKNTVATLEWIRESKPGLLMKRDNSYHSDDKPMVGWKAALAENKVDEGIKLLKAAIEKEEDADEKANLYQQLIKLGLVLDRMPIASEASQNLTNLLMAELQKGNDVSSYRYDMVFAFPATNNDWQSIVDIFTKASDLSKKNVVEHSSYSFGNLDESHATYLTALYKLNKAEDFIKGIEQAQSMTLDDPDQFFDLLAYSAPGQQPLGIFYLDHLKATGESDKLLAYTLHLLARNAGKDPFYEYLIDLDKARAKTFIKSLHEFDPFEERPLIWLAEIARREGDLELARRTIDEAITLDPSDGDHGKDTRMFCYEVLARIHEDSKEDEKAAFFRSVVDSIRQGEAADDYLYAGLIKEATERYRKALGQFEDAYCLQSRLAMTLARNGQFDEAIVHFKKAFELMPVSFGPRESHCFGCEGLFDDPRVLEIALPLLEAFEKANPDNARAPYLLGLILAEKNEPKQAILAYRRALDLDPSYFNAARKLLSLLKANPENFSESEELRKMMFAIAPYSEKPEYITQQANLHAHWKLTAEFPASPLDLPVLPFIPETLPKKDRAQYLEVEGYAHLSRYRSRVAMSLDGWSPSELRRENTFLNAVDDID